MATRHDTNETIIAGNEKSRLFNCKVPNLTQSEALKLNEWLRENNIFAAINLNEYQE